MTTFLVVDDEEDLLELVRFVLDDAVVRTAASAAEAVDHLERERADVLLLDVTMPDVDGLSLLADLRDRDLAPPVVYLVSAIPRSALDELADNHEVHVLPKPFTASQLRSALAEHLRPAA